MTTSYTKGEEFQAAQEQFQTMIEALLSAAMARCEHGEIESYRHCEGVELLRQLFQGYLDRRSQAEVAQAVVVGVDGGERCHRRVHCQRPLMSEFGEVVIDRIGYSGRGLTTLYPLDRELNLPPDKYSHGLRLRAVEEAIRGSFDGSVTAIETSGGGYVPKRQLREVAAKTSQDFLAYYGQQQRTAPAVGDLLVLSSDGKGIVMRHEDLRPATKAAAERQPARSGARLQSGQKRQRKRMAQVAAIYEVASYPRTVDELLGMPDCADDPRPPPRPRPTNKRVWASVEHSTETVLEQLFAEARERDPHQRRRWVMVIDGHEDQLRTIQRLTKYHEVELTIVIDLIHVIEYRWKAAFALFDSQHQHDQAAQWVSAHLRTLLDGHARTVAANLRRQATRRQLAQNQRQAIDDAADYLLKYQAYLHYDRYLAEGLPIGSGVIEGACRHLVNDRLAMTGARWRLITSEAVLKLRSLNSSGDLYDYFRFHQARELQRNHVAKFETAEELAA